MLSTTPATTRSTSAPLIPLMRILSSVSLFSPLLPPLPWGGDGVGDVGARYVGSHQLLWVVLVLSPNIDNVLEYE
jgi:hypothetical protein